MIKLEFNDCVLLLQIIEANQFQGKDIPTIAKLMDKLNKEATKLQPEENRSF